MANNPTAPLLAEAEIPVLLHTGSEFLAGSTRMTAGTAQKIALNLLSTQLMIELGRVYQGLMVNVVAVEHEARRPQPAHRPDHHRLRRGCGSRRLGAGRPGHQARRAARSTASTATTAAARLAEARGDLRRVRPIHTNAH